MNKDERRAWGPLIKAAREAQNLTQQDVADQAGTSRRTLGSIERGDTVAQHDVLDRLLAVLGLTPRRLDGDVEAFLAMVGPLLQMLTPEQRLAVMPEISALIAAALAAGRDTPDDLAASRAGRDLSDGPRSITDDDLAGLPSVAEPIRNDVEGDEDPLDP